jgi:hypothetical protein
VPHLKPSLGPWSVRAWTSHARTTIVQDIGGVVNVIAECGGHGRFSAQDEADAAEIVLRCNAHADLVAALRMARAQVQDDRRIAFNSYLNPKTGLVDGDGKVLVDLHDQVLAAADAALAAAGSTS